MKSRRTGQSLLLVALALVASPLMSTAGADQGQARGQKEQGTEKARGTQKAAQREQPEKAREKVQQGREQQESAKERPAEKPAERPGSTERDAAGRGNSRWANRSKEDVARFKRFLQEEAKHRQRVARMDRLRELAGKSDDSERMEKLREIKDTEQKRYDTAMARFRSEMGDEDFRDAKAFVERFGTSRGRQKIQDMREDAKREQAGKRPGTGEGR